MSKLTRKHKIIIFVAAVILLFIIFFVVLIFNSDNSKSENVKDDTKSLNDIAVFEIVKKEHEAKGLKAELEAKAEEKAREEAERLAREEEERRAKEEAERKAKEEAEKKAKEEEEKRYQESLSKEERRAAAAKTSQKNGERYKEYLECMEKANELEKTLTDDPSAWNMILCNSTHSLSDNFFNELNLKEINGNYKVDTRIWYNTRAMFLAAKLDGIDLTMVSAFRDISLQTRNFNNKKNYYMNNGMTEAQAYAKTATIIAVPGTSEHHTGLALDILTPSYLELTAGFDKTEAYRWLTENCQDFGFILRYAKDKTDITKIIYEPWHYRFVGIENAKKIKATGLSYEEYLGVTD